MRYITIIFAQHFKLKDFTKTTFIKVKTGYECIILNSDTEEELAVLDADDTLSVAEKRSKILKIVR